MLNFKSRQYGFTLIELMISITLGLLILAAALALFLGSSKNLRVQESSDDVQEAAVFSLNYIQKEIAMANLGSFTPMNQVSPWTGIVLTGSIDDPNDSATSNKNQIGNFRGIGSSVSTVNSKASSELLPFLSVSSIGTALSNSNVSKVSSDGSLGAAIASDQLTIQYRAPFEMTDCEGNVRYKNDIIVERFFTRQDLPAVSTAAEMPFNIVLACDAGWYRVDSTDIEEDYSSITSATERAAAITAAQEVTLGSIDSDNIKQNEITSAKFLANFGDNGEVLVHRVDYFKVLVGVMMEDGLNYMTINDYLKWDSTNDKYTNEGNIVAIKMGVVVRGTNPIGDDIPYKFNVLGEDVVITTDFYDADSGSPTTTPKYVRRVYESTIRLRNGMAL